MQAAVPIGRMPGLASDAEMELMETRTGRDADALFVALMHDHHRGGIHMARYAAEHASTDFVRDLADRMAAAQSLEIDEMRFARDRLGLPERPAGYVADPISSADALNGHPEH